MHSQRVVAFDVDGTLVKETSSWLTIHEFFEVEHLAQNNLRLYETGQIDYPTFMQMDISLWPKRIPVDTIDSILSRYALDPCVISLVNSLKSKGFKIVLVSAGIDLLTKKVAKDLGIDLYVANGLEVDQTGYLTGRGVFRVDLLNKHVALKNLLDTINFPLSRCISIGDSRYDATMLQWSGCGIAIGGDENLRRCAHYCIDNLNELDEIL